MTENNLDSMVITDAKNMQYLASYTGEGYMVLTLIKDYIVTDSRYTEQAKSQTSEFEILDIAFLNPKEVFGTFENTGFENESISFARYTSFSNIFKKLTPVGKKLLDMRSVKDDDEVENIRFAQHISDMAFSHILDFIKPGVSEKDIALEIEFFMKKSGAESLSFDTIVASGAHGAMPHAQPDRRLIQNGQFVTMDFGCVYNGYCSDMTRTVCVGKASEDMKNVYNTVLKAQTECLDILKAGVEACNVHNVAQRIIDERYKGAFGHGLGHGVGLNIHELPNLSPKNNGVLAENNVVTVEPGIYLSGFCGVRIEDLVVIKEQKIENFTHSLKELMEL